MLPAFTVGDSLSAVWVVGWLTGVRGENTERPMLQGGPCISKICRGKKKIKIVAPNKPKRSTDNIKNDAAWERAKSVRRARTTIRRSGKGVTICLPPGASAER